VAVVLGTVGAVLLSLLPLEKVSLKITAAGAAGGITKNRGSAVLKSKYPRRVLICVFGLMFPVDWQVWHFRIKVGNNTRCAGN
jgi:hypothetical protein